MSSADKIRDFKSHLPEVLRRRIDELVEQIREQMDVIVKREEAIDELLKIFIRLCDEMGLPREETSAFIKHELDGIVSESTIERHLPKDRKRKYERYYDLEIRQKGLPETEIELSTSGSESYTKPDGTEGEREAIDDEPLPTNEEILKTSVEMAIAANDDNEREIKELKIRLREALDLADKKQEEIEHLQLNIAEFEFKLKDAIGKVAENKKAEDKQVDSVIAEYQEENKHLKEALREKIKKETFVPAAEVEEPRTVWIAALNCFGLSRSLMQISMKLTDQSTRGKVLFDIAIDGSIKNPRLEVTQVQEN